MAAEAMAVWYGLLLYSFIFSTAVAATRPPGLPTMLEGTWPPPIVLGISILQACYNTYPLSALTVY